VAGFHLWMKIEQVADCIKRAHASLSEREGRGRKVHTGHDVFPTCDAVKSNRKMSGLAFCSSKSAMLHVAEK
jgi:hypothetical protein